MDDLYSDKDPEYRSARVNSGISPPSQRDQRRPTHRQNDLSRLNPAMQRQRHQPYDTNRRDDRYSSHDRYAQQQRLEDRYNQTQTNRPLEIHQQQRQAHHGQAQRPDERYVHERREQQQPPSTTAPVPVSVPAPKPLDFRTSTDFLKCQTRLSINDIISTLSVSNTTLDLDFLSSKTLVEKVNELRARIHTASTAELIPAARSKSNPYERIGNAIFMNRAATKLAALDATFGLTAVTEKHTEFTFADICGGPGGFSEYLLWRIHSWGGSAHGYGVTLKTSVQKDAMNWHTDKFRADIPRHCLTTVDGPDGSGDILKPETVQQFKEVVQKETKAQKGVDLAVADGGIDFSGHEDRQEGLAARLILSEIMTMLTCLKKGGHFACKFFDMVHELTADLVWLLYHLFEEVCITKPLSSRPANSERYVVCKGLVVNHDEANSLVDKLLGVSKSLDDKAECNIVPRQILEDDEDFIDYLKMRNMKFVMKQTEALEQIDLFIKNPDMAPLYDQDQVKRHCLNEWRIPLQSPQHYF